jgi:hypothetical protein
LAHSWALLVYTLPREPTAPRVAVWRALKKLKAVLLHDALWVLPGKPQTLEHFRWLASDIREAGGEAMVWMAEQGLPGQDEALIGFFLTQTEAAYHAILAELDGPDADYKALARRYHQALLTDYCHAPSGELVRSRLEGGKP